MKRINQNVLTDKGVLSNKARVAITSNALHDLESLADMGWEYFAEQKAYAMPMQDSEGHVVYATITLTVGTKAPNEKKERVYKAKPKADSEPIVID